MWRPARKHLRQRNQIEPVAHFERGLPDAMLLGMMGAAQTDGPAVGGFERNTAVGPGTDMGALDWASEAAGYRTAVLAHPGAVRGTRARGVGAPLADEARRQVQVSHAGALPGRGPAPLPARPAQLSRRGSLG